MNEEKGEKHALVSWQKSWQSDKWYFTYHKDDVEREPLNQDINVVISNNKEISGYVEDHKIDWARKQLLLERQKYLIKGISDVSQQLDEITKLLMEENKHKNEKLD